MDKTISHKIRDVFSFWIQVDFILLTHVWVSIKFMRLETWFYGFKNFKTSIWYIRWDKSNSSIRWGLRLTLYKLIGTLIIAIVKEKQKKPVMRYMIRGVRHLLFCPYLPIFAHMGKTKFSKMVGLWAKMGKYGQKWAKSLDSFKCAKFAVFKSSSHFPQYVSLIQPSVHFPVIIKQAYSLDKI